ncbi:sensor histidine kinase [Flavobacterium sp. J27]|uniref:tetratricopeptide repeat-containing sensor histidine kinase n=1 Tax=Flavobacterium sp. J27 TaxID=2060419 RepID=UPI00102FEA23|nr:sensor histidine kinase [Flavobacterium sp. J27]
MKKLFFWLIILSFFSGLSQTNVDKSTLYLDIDSISHLIKEKHIVEANTLSETVLKNVLLFDTNTQLDIYYKLSLSYLHYSYNDEAKKILLAAIPKIKQNNNPEIKGKLYKQLCYIGMIEYDIPSATKYYELAKQEFSKTKQSNLLFNLDLLAFKMYLNLKKYDSALEIATNSYAKSIQSKDSAQSINAISTFIDYYKAIKDYKNVLYYTKKGVEISSNGYQNSYSYFLEEEANVYIHLKKYDSATYFFKKAYRAVANDSSSFHDYKTWRINKLGAELYALLNDKENALKYLALTREYPFENNLKEQSEYLFFKASVYEKIGDYDLALKNLRVYLNLKEEIDKKEAQRYLIKYTSLYESIEKEKKINTLIKENHEKENLIYKSDLKRKFILFYFSLLFLFSILSLFLWYQFKTKKIVIKAENLRFQSVIDAQEKERIRIAKDLHDSLGQNICAIKMMCSNSLNLEDKSNQKLVHIIDETYEEIRTISHNMMPNAFIKKGLVPAIKEMIQKIEDSSTIHFNFEYDFPDTIEENIAISVYRIIQESLSNIIKHAKASQVKIILGKEKKNYVLLIKDNGVGSKELSMTTLINENENTSQKLGIGLKNILSRTKMIKGSIYIDSTTKGTTLRIIF